MTHLSLQQPDAINGHSANDSSSTEQTTGEAAATTPIRPGQIVKLTVPKEDIGALITPSEEIVGAASVKIRKVAKEWIRINRATAITTRLLCHKPNPGGFDEDYYFVDPALRHAVQDAMCDVRVFEYFAVRANVHGLWIVKVNPELSCYERLELLFARPESFFAEHEIKIKWDKVGFRYRVFTREAKFTTEWSPLSTEEKLGAALGEDHFIRSTDHPLYPELAGGQEL